MQPPADSARTADECTELLQPGPAEALAGLLDVPLPDLYADGLPLMWHWVYLLDRPAQKDLGPEGHPVRGTALAPPEPGRRRMWAGGSVTSLGLLRLGAPATRTSRVESVVEKHGRSGRLTFVAVRHLVRQAGRTVVDERQDLVYRDHALTGEPEEPGPALPVEPEEWEVDVTPTLLFRFSALTYNAHRIHYDRDYATGVEGYPGLLTHGPLQALVMAEALRARGVATRPGLTCEYRLTAPLFDHQGLVAQATRTESGGQASIRDCTGRRTAHATVTTS